MFLCSLYTPKLNDRLGYILEQEEKRKLFRKMSVRPSVRPCAKVKKIKTQERCILGIETAKISTRTHEDLRS